MTIEINIMEVNKRIISNLETLLHNNYETVRNTSLKKWIDNLIRENPDAFSFNEQKIVKLYDDASLQNFELAKKNSLLISKYETAINFNINETEVLIRFSKDLENSFEAIKKIIKHHKDSKLQIILLSYDFAPYVWISGYGEGNYPILEEPKYFDFNYKIDFFEGQGKIDFSFIWANLLTLQDSLEKANIFDETFDTEIFQCIKKSYIYKTYLLLNKAFELNKDKLFADLEIKKPLHIYGHEHDCEKINIYCYT